MCEASPLLGRQCHSSTSVTAPCATPLRTLRMSVRGRGRGRVGVRAGVGVGVGAGVGVRVRLRVRVRARDRGRRTLRMSVVWKKI